MRNCLAVLTTLTFAVGALAADQTPGQLDPAVFDRAFYAIYPELVPHKDVVTAAMISMLGEGFRGPTMTATLRALANRARTNVQIAQRSEPVDADAEGFAGLQAASTKEARRLYPEVAVPDSQLGRR